MKYTLHFSGFYDNIRLNPTHISVFLALFQFWNLNYFQNLSSIFRNEIIKLSKITVFGTYHKYIKGLQNFAHIEFLTSFNSCKKSLGNLYNFDERAVQNPNSYHTKNQTSSAQALNQHHIKIDTGIEQALIPSINYINILNNKHIITTPETCSNFKQAFLRFILHEEIVPKTLNQNFKEKEKLRQKKKKVSPIHFEKKYEDGGKKKISLVQIGERMQLVSKKKSLATPALTKTNLASFPLVKSFQSSCSHTIKSWRTIPKTTLPMTQESQKSTASKIKKGKPQRNNTEMNDVPWQKSFIPTLLTINLFAEEIEFIYWDKLKFQYRMRKRFNFFGMMKISKTKESVFAY
jgi:hypothetical protein